MKYRTLAACALAPLATAAFAHEGHGLSGASHWHATDTFGLLAIGAIVVAMLWFSRGGK